MMNTAETLESDILNQLKQEYERKGYRFFLEPSLEQIPDFLKGFRPDAIALGESESVVIELKSTSASATQSAAVSFLAREVPKHSGWRFQLVIAEKQFDRSDSSAEPSRDQLFSEFEKVKNFTTFGDYNVALVTGWALLEAITRRLVLTNRAGEVKRYLPRTIVETLVSEGLVDDGVGERLMAIVNVRNRLVHGFTGQKVQLADLNILTKVIENLLMGLNT